jgi:endonuclease G
MKPLADLLTQPEGGLESSKGPLPGAGEGLEADKTHEPDYFKGRKGFNPDFLHEFRVDLPVLSEEIRGDAAPLLADPGKYVLHYENFSLVMSKSRRLAFFTACNIEGELSARDRLARQGKDKWFYDLRIDPKYQIGEALYVDNELDRGHLVRREDPVWGENAIQANDDTFHFTNCSPQHSGFNQKTWLGLENYILHNARTYKLQATVFTGPVFTDRDPLYRKVRIPRSYWKVVAIFSEGQRSATAYEIKQDSLIANLEFLYGSYKTYQVSIRKVERMTGLQFGQLAMYDGFSNEEAAVGSEISIPLTDWRAIRV